MDFLRFDSARAHHWPEDVAWLRALAASLVRDPEEASDLAGEVWVEALRRLPSADEQRSLRPWLSVVLRRLVVRRRRERVARTGRERQVARPEAVPGADRAIEQVEFQRLLADAVLALDEPYRSAVVLRHLERLSPAEIAERQQCSVEAARQRVARGLRRLRVRLDREFDGGRDAWMAVLVPFAHTGAPHAAGTALGAGVIGGKLALGLALAAAASFLWWWLPGSGKEPTAFAVLEQEPSPAGSISTGSPASAQAGGSGTDIPATTAQRVQASRLVAGHVVDSTGMAVPGARLEFLSLKDESSVAASALSDGTGSFQSDLGNAWLAGRQLEILASSDDAGFLPTSTFVDPSEPVRIVLRRGARVEVRVIASDGAVPSGDVWLSLGRGEQFQWEFASVRLELDEDGVARSGPLQPARLARVRVDAWDHAVTEFLRTDELVADTTLRIEVRVAPGVRIRGEVLDERTRRPVQGAVVRAESSTATERFRERSDTSDEQGRFEIRGVSPSGRTFVAAMPVLGDVYRLDVEAAGYAFPPARRLVGWHAANALPPEVIDDVELLLVTVGANLWGTLSWPDGKPSGDTHLVRAFDADGNVFETRSDGPDFAFDSLPAGELRLIATPADDDAPRSLAQAQLRLASGEERELDLVLHRADVVVEGRVLDREGRGLGAVHVSAHAYVQQSGKRTWLAGRTGVTDELGRYRIEGLYPGLCEIQVEPGEAHAHLGFWPPLFRMELDEGRSVRTLDFLAEPAVVYAGRVEPWPAPESSLPVLLELTHPELGPVAAVWVGDDGRFVYPGVFGAAYAIVARQERREVGRLATTPAGASELVVPLSR